MYPEASAVYNWAPQAVICHPSMACYISALWATLVANLVLGPNQDAAFICLNLFMTCSWSSSVGPSSMDGRPVPQICCFTRSELNCEFQKAGLLCHGARLMESSLTRSDIKLYYIPQPPQKITMPSGPDFLGDQGILVMAPLLWLSSSPVFMVFILDIIKMLYIYYYFYQVCNRAQSHFLVR